MKKLFQSWSIAAMLALLICSCSSLKVSRYAKYNRFTYTSEQPDFNFTNDALKVRGAWWWATGNRAIPKVTYLPDSIRKILKPYIRSNGPVLFATFYPNHSRYRVKGEVPVTRNDVRRVKEFAEPFYEVVLYSSSSFAPGPGKYVAKGKTNDYQFEIYHKPPVSALKNYDVAEAVAASSSDYFTFLVIRGKQGNGRDDAPDSTRYDGLTEDIKLYFERD